MSFVAGLEIKDYTCTFQQCREKINGLKMKYKDVVDRLCASGVEVDSDNDLDDHKIFVCV